MKTTETTERMEKPTTKKMEKTAKQMNEAKKAQEAMNKAEETATMERPAKQTTEKTAGKTTNTKKTPNMVSTPPQESGTIHGVPLLRMLPLGTTLSAALLWLTSARSGSGATVMRMVIGLALLVGGSDAACTASNCCNVAIPKLAASTTSISSSTCSQGTDSL